MATRHVLTVNQVLEIMLRWLEVRDWEKAFLSVIPKRKLPELPESKDASEVDEIQEAKDNTA
jgi:tRNA (guanine9-N1)-methyltransferase